MKRINRIFLIEHDLQESQPFSNVVGGQWWRTRARERFCMTVHDNNGKFNEIKPGITKRPHDKYVKCRK